MNEIAVVTEQDIPDILRMIHEIYSELPNKEWFSLDSDEEVTSYMMTGGFGLKAMCDGRLAGVFIARAKNLGDENLGYDLKFDEDALYLSVGLLNTSYREEYCLWVNSENVVVGTWRPNVTYLPAEEDMTWKFTGTFEPSCIL